MEEKKHATLALQDGTVFHGEGFGAETRVSGEVVFNTSMYGYPELLTDPSYYQQIVAMTYPIIGSYGVSSYSLTDKYGVPLDFESDSVKVKGYAVHSLSALPSPHRMGVSPFLQPGFICCAGQNP